MASLTYMKIDQFIGKVVKDADMGNSHVIIISNNIIVSVTKKGPGNMDVVESKYKNIHFAENLYPEPRVQTYADRFSEREMFREAYIEQITRDDNFGDVCAIVDLVADKGKDVILVTGPFEYSMGFLEILSIFIKEEFGLESGSYDQIERGDISPREIDTENQDVETIKKNLNSFVVEAMKLETKEDLYNRFCDDLETKYKEILMRKSIEQLHYIADDRGYKINKRLEKKEYVDELFDRMFPRNSLGY